MTEYEGVDMDEIYNTPFDDEGAEQVRAASLPPQGYYTTNPDEFPPTVIPRMVDEKTGEQVTGQRRVIKVVARVEAVINNKAEVALVRFDISPDKRHAKVYENGEWTGEFKTKYDMNSVRWAQFGKVYEQTMGEKPKVDANVIEFIKTTPFKVKVGHFNGEVSVNEIQKAR